MINRREGIIDAFGKLAASYGLSKTSMKDVAREAGVSPGTIYNEFGDKEELIVAYWLRIEEQCVRQLASLVSRDLPAEELLQLLMLEWVRIVGEMLRSNRGLFELMTESVVSYIGKAMIGRRQKIQQVLTARVEEILRAGIAQGVFAVEGDVSTAAVRFVEAFTEYLAPPLVLARTPEAVLVDAASMFAFVVRAVRKAEGTGN